MAQSRLNKVSSIFTRVNGLLRANLIPENEKPIWYDIYKAFPPDRDPTYRSIAGTSPDELPSLPRKILYPEDQIRAAYFKQVTPIETQVLNADHRQPIWEKFIQVYYDLQKTNIPKEELLEKTCDQMTSDGFMVILNSKKKDEISAAAGNELELSSIISNAIKNIQESNKTTSSEIENASEPATEATNETK